MRGGQDASSISSTIQDRPSDRRGVTIADAREGDWRALGKSPTEVPNCTPRMVHPGAPNDLVCGIEDS